MLIAGLALIVMYFVIAFMSLKEGNAEFMNLSSAFGLAGIILLIKGLRKGRVNPGEMLPNERQEELHRLEKSIKRCNKVMTVGLIIAGCGILAVVLLGIFVGGNAAKIGAGIFLLGIVIGLSARVAKDSKYRRFVLLANT